MTGLSIRTMSGLAKTGLAALALALLGACAGPDPALTRAEPYDPFERSNRLNHERNKRLDSAVLRPVSMSYSAAVPDPAETAIKNFSNNLSLPGAIVNNALQGNGVGMTSDFYRFLVNTTIGLGGLVDVATGLEMPPATDADFGQTLYVWGVHEGPYVQLPLLGPSTARGAVGRVVDIFVNPLDYAMTDDDIYYALGARAGRAMTNRARYGGAIDSVLYDSADSYAATRSLYLQNRRFKLSGRGSDTYLDPYDGPGGVPATSAPVSADYEDPYDQ